MVWILITTGMVLVKVQRWNTPMAQKCEPTKKSKSTTFMLVIFASGLVKSFSLLILTGRTFQSVKRTVGTLRLFTAKVACKPQKRIKTKELHDKS